eukprot:894288_1
MANLLEIINFLIFLLAIAAHTKLIFNILYVLITALICTIVVALSILIPYTLFAALFPAIKTVQEKKNKPRRIAPVINNKTRKNFLNVSANKKKNCVQLPSVTEIKSHYKAAEDLTTKILQKSNNNKLNDRNTLLNILGNISQQGGKPFLFYDSNETKMDPNQNKAKELKFTLNLEGFETDQKVENEVDTVIEMKSYIDSKKSHPILDNFKQKLAQVYNVTAEQIKIVDMFCGTINITYVVDVPKNNLDNYYKENISGEQGDIENRMKKQFKNYKDCKIHAILYRDSFDINMFAKEGNKTFGSGDTYKVGPKGCEQDYIQPSGWVRFGLNIINSGKYGCDHTWLDPFQHVNNWYRCYHGTGSSGNTSGKNVDVMAWIFNGGFHYANNAAYGAGIYCSPDPKWLEDNYAGVHTLNGKKYKFMLQCGANPNGVRIYQDKHCGKNWVSGKPWGPIWVANTPNDIRPYGILIKEV